MKIIKSYTHLILLLLLFVVSTGGYIWFAYSSYYQPFVDWSVGNVFVYYPVVVIIKTVGIIWPPLPGAVLTIGSIWIIGWLPAYLADFLGSILGSSIAYAIAYRWGYPIMAKILDQKTIQHIKQVRVKKGREVEAVFLFRFFGGTLLEIVCYAAGVLRVPFRSFLVGSIASHLVVGIPTFYFFDHISAGNHLVWNGVLLMIAVVLFLYFRKRYFTSTQTFVS